MLGVTMPVETAFMLLGEVAVGIVLLTAFVLALTHRGAYHHWMMLAAFLFDELVLKAMMVQKLMQGVLGDFPYTGTSGLPHLLLSTLCTVAGLLAIYLGFRFRVKKDRRMFMPPKGRIHKVAGAVYIVSWLASFVIGLAIFRSSYL